MTRVIKVIAPGPQGPPGPSGLGTLAGLTDVTGTPGAGKAPVGDGAGHYALTDIATQAELDAETSARTTADAGRQPLDSDLTALAALDASSAGAIASDGAGWIKKTYAQLKTALGIVAADVSGLGTLATQNGTFSGTSSGTNTGDQTSVSGNAGTATALQTGRTIDGQTFDGTQNITVIAPGSHAATSKATPVDADELPLVDSAASNVLKKLTWANLKATIKAYTDTLYPSGSGTSSGTNTGDQTSVSGNAGTATALQTARAIDGQSFDGTAAITVIAPGSHAATSKATPVDADELPLVDSAASNVLKKLTWANLKATLKTYFDTLYQASGASAGGDLTGTYPSPTLAAAGGGAAGPIGSTVAIPVVTVDAKGRVTALTSVTPKAVATDVIWDTKGDLAVGTGADTAAKLAVGANGLVARADSNQTSGIGWAQPLLPWANWIPSSGKIETIPRIAVSSSALALTSGTLYLFALPTPLLAGVTYSSITFVSNGGASSPTHQWFTLVNKSDLKTLRTTTDDTTTAWGGTTAKTLNLSSSYTPTADTDVYLGIMVAATTPITVRTAAAIQNLALAPTLFGTSGTGLTTAPADGTTMTALTVGSVVPFYGFVS